MIPYHDLRLKRTEDQGKNDEKVKRKCSLKFSMMR